METSTADGTLSLYFQLKEGEKADLEVVAQVALSWVEALRAVAQEIEPETQIRVELIDAAEGSLKLNTVLDFIEKHIAKLEAGSGRHPRLRKLALALAIFLPISGYPTYDFYFGEHSVELSEQDRAVLTEILKEVQGRPEVEQKKQKFYRSLEKDPTIKGIGFSEHRDDKPSLIVPSSQFAERGGLWQIAEEEPPNRTIYPVLDVTLISPVLVKKPRAWLFQPDGLPEFSAKMQDSRFLAALEEDHVRERLRIGIKMTIRLKVEEKNVGGVWQAKSRAVIEVISPRVD